MNTQCNANTVKDATVATGFTGTRAVASLQNLSQACLIRLGKLKERVTAELLAEYGSAVSATLLRQAVSEADSLATTTPFPSFFLPALAEEKVRLASEWSQRQQAIREPAWALAA